MVKPFAPTASGGIGSGLSANNQPTLPRAVGSSGYNPSGNLRPYGSIGKANAGFFATSVPARMNLSTGGYFSPEMTQPTPPERAPFADVPVIGQITQAASSLLGSELIGNWINPQHAITRTKVWEEGIDDPDRAKWQRMIDTNAISLADAQARFLREQYAQSGEHDLFLDVEAPGDNSATAQLASKLVFLTMAGQRVTQKSGVGVTLGPVTIGGRNWKDRLTELDSASDAQLENNPILIDIRDAHKAGELDDNRTMDHLIVAGFGTQNPTMAKYGAVGPLISLAEELTTDPISVLEILTGGLAKASTIAAAQSAKAIARVAGDDLVKVVTKRMLEKGYSFGRRGVDHIFVREMMSSPDTLAVLEKAMGTANPVTRFLVMDAPRIHALGTKINVMLDPLSYFGRDEIGMLTAKSFGNKAAMGVIDGFGARNVRAVNALVSSTLGGEAARKLDEAFDVAGMNVALQVGADHSISHVRGSRMLDGFEGATVNEIAMGNARRMGNDLRRVVADKTERIRYRFVPLEAGKPGVKKMMESARARASAQLANLTGVSEAEASRVVARMTDEQLSILDFQHFGKVINDFVTAREAAQQAGEQIGGNEARRATFLGPRQLTRQGFKEFRKAVKKGKTAQVRQMIEEYDTLYSHFSLDMPDKELMDLVTSTLDQIEKQLPTEIVDMATVPAALRQFFDQYTGMGYRLGLMPMDEDLMRPVMRDGQVVSINPWVDFVNEKLARKNISRYMVTREMLFRNISGTTVVRDAQSRFVSLGARHLGLSQGQSNEMFRAIRRTAEEANLSPRGLDARSMYDAVWRADVPKQVLARVSERQIAELVLESFEGSLKYVGVSQKFTGMAKTAMFKVTGMNYAGTLAENLYPKLRFTHNPMFQAMELVETPILLLLRGYLPMGDLKAAVTKSGRNKLMDEVERTHLVMDIMSRSRPSGRSFIDTAVEYTNSFIRPAERVVNASLAERGLTSRAGDIFGRFRPNVHAVKRWGEARAFEYRMADEMMGAISGASPESWRNYSTWLMQRSRYNNDRTAIRHFLYDVVARGNPEAAYARLGPGAFKPEHLGAQTRIIPEFVMSLTEGQEAASGMKWADYRKRVRDRNDPLTVGQVEDALREVQADPHYTQRVLDSLTAPTPVEFYKGLQRLGRSKGEIDALRRSDRAMAQARGLSWDEYVSRRYAQAPGTVDSMGNTTQPTLFQQIADAAQRRGKVVLDHESPERVEMTRIISEMMDGVYEEPPLGMKVKDMTPGQKKFYSYQQAHRQRYGDPETGKVGDPNIGLPPTETVHAVTRAQWPELQSRVEKRIEALRQQADVTEAGVGRGVKGIAESEDYVSREFESQMEQDLSDWTDGLIGTYGTPNAIQSFDLPLRRDWEGAPTIEIAGEAPTPKPEGEMVRVYAQYDEEGSIAGYTIISLGNEGVEKTSGLTQAVLKTNVRPDARRKGVASALYDQATDDGIPMKEVSGTWGLTGEGKPFSEAYKAKRGGTAKTATSVDDLRTAAPSVKWDLVDDLPAERYSEIGTALDAFTEDFPRTSELLGRVASPRRVLGIGKVKVYNTGRHAGAYMEELDNGVVGIVIERSTLTGPRNMTTVKGRTGTMDHELGHLLSRHYPDLSGLAQEHIAARGGKTISPYSMADPEEAVAELIAARRFLGPKQRSGPFFDRLDAISRTQRGGDEAALQAEAATKSAEKLRNKAKDMERRLLALQESDESDKAIQRAIQKAYDSGDIEEGQRLQRLLSAEGASGAGGAATDVPGLVVRDGVNWHRFGPVTGEQWWEQLRNVLGNGSDESPLLRELADWYHDMRRGILAFVNNDPKEAARLLTGFGVSQLNTSPPDGMRHLLRAIGIHGRGDVLPIDKRITGLNSALMKILLEDDTLVPEGLGQKLIDFIDSLAGKKNRTAGVHGPDINNPWQPVAGDIWAKRDLGYVDAKMAEHIAYMYGVRARDVLFDKEIGFVVRKGDQRFVIPTEKITGGSPSDVEYDHVVEFYNARKDEANAKGWMGRSDWSAAEMQAVGWFRAKMAMGDATGSPLDAMYRNRHNVAWEAVPSTNAQLIEQFPFMDGAPEHVVRSVTEQVGRHVANEVSEATGVRVIAHYGSNGSWTSPDGTFSLTPNMVFEIATGDQNDVFAFTASMAYLTQQKGVSASRLMRTTKAGKYSAPKPAAGQLWAVDWAPSAGTISSRAQAEAVLDQLVQSNAIVKAGATIIRYDDGSYGIRATCVPEAVGHKEWLEASTIPQTAFQKTWTDEMIGGAVEAEGVSFVPGRVTVESSHHLHDWEADPSGQGILDALRERGYGATADKLERGARSRTRLVYEHAYQRADPEGLARWRTSHVIDDPVYEQRAGALLNADLSDDDVIARGNGAIQSGDLLFQRAPRGTLGAVSFDAADRNRASLFLNPAGQRKDTLIHELSHQFAEQELDPSAKLMLLDVYNAAIGNNTLTRRGRTPGRNVAGHVPATAWNEDVHEWFADQFVAWMRNGEVPHPMLAPLMEYYAKYLKTTTSYAGVLSPEVKSILDDLAKRPITRALPYNADEALLFSHAWGAATRAQRRAKDLVYFKTNRSWLERSLNHPYFGLYPLSYMWGKILPDLLNFLMFKPFGFEAPMAAFNVTYRIYRQMMQQVAYDEEMQTYLQDNEPALRALAMFIPGLPWDLPANAPLYMRRIVEALATQDSKAAAGQMKKDGTPYEIDPTEIDYGRIITESLGYAFGPYKGVESLIDSAQGAATMGGALASGVLDQALPESAPRPNEVLPPLAGEGAVEQRQSQPQLFNPTQMGSGLPNTQPPSNESPTTTTLREEMTDAQTQLEEAFQPEG